MTSLKFTNQTLIILKKLKCMNTNLLNILKLKNILKEEYIIYF